MKAGPVLIDFKLELERDFLTEDGSPVWWLIWARGSVLPLFLFKVRG